MNGEASRKLLRILIVDDEAIVRDSLGAWFRQDGHHVELAPNAKDALRQTAAGRYDLAFLDIKMPGMDGLELQARLAEADPELTIVLMTAYASVDTAVKAMKAGAYDYIVKPFDPDDLSLLVSARPRRARCAPRTRGCARAWRARPRRRCCSAARPRCGTSSSWWRASPRRTRRC
jgi:DNA-binding NtrC family response regulator